MSYPPSIVEQAQVLRLAGHSLRDIQSELAAVSGERPSHWTIWKWCQDAPNETVQVKYKDYQRRIASMSMSLKEIKLQEALEDPSKVSFAEVNMLSGTDVDKLIGFERIEQTKQPNLGPAIQIVIQGADTKVLAVSQEPIMIEGEQ